MIESVLQQPLALSALDWAGIATFLWLCFFVLTQRWTWVLIISVVSLGSMLAMLVSGYAAWNWMALLFWVLLRRSEISWKAFDQALYEITLSLGASFSLMALLGSMVYLGLNEGAVKDAWVSSVFGFYWMSLAELLDSILAF